MEVRSTRRVHGVTKARLSSTAAAEPEDWAYRSLLDSLDVGVARVAATGDLLYANQTFLNLTGADLPPNGAPRSLNKFISPASWSVFQKALQQALEAPTEGQMTIESVGLPSRTVRLSLRPLHSPAGTSVSVVALDLTELSRMQKNLQESEKSLQALSGRILRLQDQERRRIARDLHDVIGQEVAVVSVTLDRLEKQLRGARPDTLQMIGEAVRLLTRIQDEIRTLSYLLHPPMLDELGIASALGMYVEGFEKRSGIEVSFEVPEDFPRLSNEQEIALFRVVQEALTNVLRHSGSKSALVRLAASQDHVDVTVRDKGMGIAPDVLKNLTEKHVQVGVGIPGLRERLKQLGGTLDVRSVLPGTEISASLPRNLEENIAPDTGSALGTRVEPAVEHPSAHSDLTRKRVLIADDHELTRRGVRHLLCSQPDIEVCGEAADGLDAVNMVHQLEPDLVVLDTSMPRAGGLYAAHMIRDQGIKCKILIFADHRFPQLEATLRTIHCDGYVLKSNVASDFLRAIRALLAGHEFFPPPALKAK